MAFISLEDTSTDCDDTFPKIESFVCSMYGFENCYIIDEIGYQMFLQNYKVRKMDLTFLKKYSISMLPATHFNKKNVNSALNQIPNYHLKK